MSDPTECYSCLGEGCSRCSGTGMRKNRGGHIEVTMAEPPTRITRDEVAMRILAATYSHPDCVTGNPEKDVAFAFLAADAFLSELEKRRTR